MGREDSDRPVLPQPESAAEPFDAQDPGLQSGPLVSQPLGMTKEQRAKLIAEFM